jgi:hypothetical protein
VTCRSPYLKKCSYLKLVAKLRRVDDIAATSKDDRAARGKSCYTSVHGVCRLRDYSRCALTLRAAVAKPPAFNLARQPSCIGAARLALRVALAGDRRHCVASSNPACFMSGVRIETSVRWKANCGFCTPCEVCRLRDSNERNNRLFRKRL